MPQLIIDISEEQEKKIKDAIINNRDFLIDGGIVEIGWKTIFLEEIVFRFIKPSG